jgi:hypothetical protein
MVIAQRRLLTIGITTVSVLAVLLVPAPGVEAARKNGIIFEIETSQGIAGRLTYVKNYEGEGRNFAQLEVEVVRDCVDPVLGTTRERVPVILQGRTKGNGFSSDFTQNTATDQFQQTVSVRFKPKGRRVGLPRWKKAVGSVRAFRAIHDPFLDVECDSGPVDFVTTSSRRVRFGPRPPIIIVIPPLL